MSLDKYKHEYPTMMTAEGPPVGLRKVEHIPIYHAVSDRRAPLLLYIPQYGFIEPALTTDDGERVGMSRTLAYVPETP